MRNIDLYTYKDEPFTIYRRNGIYPLNNKGKERYISNISHNYNYHKLINPKVYRQIISVDDTSIPLSMREKMWVDTPNPFKENHMPCKTEADLPVKVSENIENENKIEQPPVEEKKEEKKPIAKTVRSKTLKKKLRFKKLPAISLNNSIALPKLENEKIEDEPCQTEGNVLENHHKKLTLPELMKSQKLRYKPIISNIRLINSKEFSTNYCPYPSFMKTGDCIRTNVYGAKFCH